MGVHHPSNYVVIVFALTFVVGVVRGSGVPTPYEVRTFMESDLDKGYAFEEGALDKETFAYYTDERIHVVRSVNLATGEVATIAGKEGVQGNLDGPLAKSTLSQPRGVCLSPCDAHLYVVDGAGSTVRQIDLTRQVITTIAGVPNTKGWQDGAGPLARFSAARAPLCLANGSIIVSDASNHPMLRVVSPPSGTTCLPGPDPPPFPDPPAPHSHSVPGSNKDMAVHSLALIGACAVLAIVMLTLARAASASVVRERIQSMRRRHEGPPRGPPIEIWDEESGGDTLAYTLLPPPPPAEDPPGPAVASLIDLDTPPFTGPNSPRSPPQLAPTATTNPTPTPPSPHAAPAAAAYASSSAPPPPSSYPSTADAGSPVPPAPATPTSPSNHAAPPAGPRPSWSTKHDYFHDLVASINTQPVPASRAGH